MERDRIVIIDGNSLINRAYYAIQRPMITKEGLYTHAVYGFLTMLGKIKTDYEPQYLAVAFDRKAPTFRHLEYKEYKAGRKKMPPELAMQLPLLKEVLAAMNITMLEIDGFEADDIIGTVARRGEENGLSPLIITGDRDALQLASDKTTVLLTKKGISEFELYDRQAMIDKYGFTPEQFIDYKGLMGDSSDNIPGLPGVGEKTAQKLILQFGSVAEMIRRTDEISSAKLREKVEEYAELAVMSRRLATIITEVPIEIDFEACRVREADPEKLIDCYRKLEFNSFLKKLSQEGAAAAPSAAKVSEEARAEESASESEPVAAEVKARPVIVMRTRDQVKALAEEAKTEGVLRIKTFGDDNHKGAPLLEGMTLQTETKSYYVSGNDIEVMDEVKKLFAEQDFALAGHGIKKEYYALMAEGFDLDRHPVKYDTAISQYLLQPSRSSYDLDVISMELGLGGLVPEKEFLAGNGQLSLFNDSSETNSQYGQLWLSTCEAVNQMQMAQIRREELTDVLETIELPLIPVMASMEHFGIAVDRNE
ncbi:MAG: DNA polymerase I, partial [Firmicutes bacterium]|nr:DNA polymerase I [Bacillota bacterium]